MSTSFAISTWYAGFVIALTLFLGSFLCVKWNKCKFLVKKYLLHKCEHDYKEIFKHYLQHINSIQDKRSLYRTILQVTCEIVLSHDASLLLKDNGEYTVKESFGSKPASFQIGGVNNFIKWLKGYGKTVCREQLVNGRDFIKVKGDGLQYCVQFHAETCVPLMFGGKLIGIINIGSRTNSQPFDSDTMELLDILGGQIAVAINNATLYEDIVRRNVKLQELDRLKSQLLSNVSHEFRTPLNSIIGLAEIMREGGDGEVKDEQKKHLEMIIDSGKRLTETITAMVDLAKLEANHLSLNVKRLNLQKMLAKITEGQRPNEKTTMKLTVENAPPIYGDEQWLNKLFSHVINNAVKYTPNGEIIVNAERVGEMLKVVVKDTGVGIDPDKQKIIFESFNQGHNGVDRPYEGAGLGLAISKKVVELHGGRIWFSSLPGKGSNFFFTLPLKPTSVKTLELA